VNSSEDEFAGFEEEDINENYFPPHYDDDN